MPSPRLAIHDPWALRALVVVLLVATAIAAGGDRRARIAAAFDWQGVIAVANVRLDAWVAPPPYTGRPPIILSGAVNNPNAQPTPDNNALQVPAGSTLVIRASGGRLDIVTSGGISEAARRRQAAAGRNRRAPLHDHHRRRCAGAQPLRPAAVAVRRAA